MITKEQYIEFLEKTHRELVNNRKKMKAMSRGKRKAEGLECSKFTRDDEVFMDDTMVVMHKSTYNWILLAIYNEFIHKW